MLLKKIDFLSPSSTLYFYGQRSHSNCLSGILTIIGYFLYILALGYFSIDVINRKNPTSYFYHKIIEDAGIFSMDSSMFHFLKINGKKNLSMIQVFGIENVSFSILTNEKEIKEDYNHYIYSLCTKDMKKYISKNILSQIDDEIFEKNTTSFCIESYYNLTTKKLKKYYEKDFVYPKIKHGQSNPNATFYSLFIQKCINSSYNNNSCDSLEKINNDLSGIGIDLRLLINDIDIKNYKNPFIYSFYSVTSGFSPISFSLNNLNFEPLILKSHNGLFFDSIKQFNSYKFEQNEKQTWSSSYFIGSYFFWMQNNAIIYERNYNRIQNILVNFGGITKAISIILNCLNWFIYKFILLKDINRLLFNVINNKKSRNKKILHLNFSDNTSILGLNKYNINKTMNNNISLFKNEIVNNIDNDIKKKFEQNFEIQYMNKDHFIFKKITYGSFIQWIIHCQSISNKKTKYISTIYLIYKKFISEESLFHYIFKLKKLKKLYYLDINNIYKTMKIR